VRAVTAPGSIDTTEGATVFLSAHRRARNQVIFREVNERPRTPAEVVPDGNADYLCECSDVSCTEKIELAPVEYEAVRRRPGALFIVPGHESLEVERVVDDLDRYTIIERIVPVDDIGPGALSPSAVAWPAR